MLQYVLILNTSPEIYSGIYIYQFSDVVSGILYTDYDTIRWSIAQSVFDLGPRTSRDSLNWINRYAMQYHAKLSTYSEYSLSESCESVPLIDFQIQPTNRDMTKYMETTIWIIWVKITFYSSNIRYGNSKWNSKLVQYFFLNHCHKASTAIVWTLCIYIYILNQ
jgi:hypothetical protein